MPITITSMPQMMPKALLFTTLPRAPAPKPSATKTVTRPSVNASELSSLEATDLRSPSASAAKKATYTGKTGSVQGEKNDTKPAASAASTEPIVSASMG